MIRHDKVEHPSGHKHNFARGDSHADIPKNRYESEVDTCDSHNKKGIEVELFLRAEKHSGLVPAIEKIERRNAGDEPENIKNTVSRRQDDGKKRFTADDKSDSSEDQACFRPEKRVFFQSFRRRVFL